MKLYRFSPIKNEKQLIAAIRHIHFECHKLCKNSFNLILPNAGNVGVFCHYSEEYKFLTALRKKLTYPSSNINQKYFRLRKPIVIPAKGDVPKTTYSFLYIRKPDPYRFHVGDIDFYLDAASYGRLKKAMRKGMQFPGARIFDRKDLDMVELFDPDCDALGYVSAEQMTKNVHVKIYPSKTRKK